MDGNQHHLMSSASPVIDRKKKVGTGRLFCAAQHCCGALHAHAGDAATARELARRNIAAFEASGGSAIAINAAGCGAMVKQYGHLLQDDPAWAARARIVMPGWARGTPRTGSRIFFEPIRVPPRY